MKRGFAAIIIIGIVLCLNACSQPQKPPLLTQYQEGNLTESVRWAYETVSGDISGWCVGKDAVALQLTTITDSGPKLVSLQADSGTAVAQKDVSLPTTLNLAFEFNGFIKVRENGVWEAYDENLKRLAADTANKRMTVGPSFVIMPDGVRYSLCSVGVQAVSPTGDLIWETTLAPMGGGTESMLLSPRIAKLDDSTLLVYGLGYSSLTAVRIADGTIAWSYTPERGTFACISSVSVGQSGILATTVINERYGEAVLLSTDGDVIWTAEFSSPAYIGQIVPGDEGETYWCMSGVGEGLLITRGDGNIIYRISDGVAEKQFVRVSYRGTSSLQTLGKGLLFCGYDDGAIHILRQGEEAISINFAEAGEYDSPILLGANDKTAFVALKPRQLSDYSIIIAVDLPET